MDAIHGACLARPGYGALPPGPNDCAWGRHAPPSSWRRGRPTTRISLPAALCQLKLALDQTRKVTI